VLTLTRFRYIAYNFGGDISKSGIYPCDERRIHNMFGRFAYQGQGGNWEGRDPRWQERDWGPRSFGKRIWREFFGPGRSPFGPEGPFGEGQRFFGRGDVKFALLELLQERPMHGYEMMKALEERSGGFYVPSAGTIYPTLQMLEDSGLVTSKEVNGKRIYSITDAGRAALNERQKENEEFAGPFWGRFGPQVRRWNSPELQALRSEAMEVARLFTIAGRKAFENPQELARLRAIMERTRQELSAMIYGSTTQQDSGPSSSKVEDA
jgi:DNA-binding PadR family transcriptional regulator